MDTTCFWCEQPDAHYADKDGNQQCRDCRDEEIQGANDDAFDAHMQPESFPGEPSDAEIRKMMNW